jgi:hypothetical protein
MTERIVTLSAAKDLFGWRIGADTWSSKLIQDPLDLRSASFQNTVERRSRGNHGGGTNPLL